jgi:HlyD family secretion protein
MKKAFYVLIAILFIIAIYMVLKPKAIPVEIATIQANTFYETLTTEGKIRSKIKKTVYAFASGDLQSLQVKTGELVSKGQTLTKIDWDQVTKVQSPIDGVITKVYRDSAGPVNRGEPIFEVSSLSELEVVADLLTTEALRLSKEGFAKIINWGGDTELNAKIKMISKAGSVKTSALGVEEERTEVVLSLENIPPLLKEKFGDNFHVDILFQISSTPNVLTVPLGALFKTAQQWAVYVVQKNNARNSGVAHLVEIQIGKRNEREAIVTSGLQATDQVILFPGDKIHDGVRVQY